MPPTATETEDVTDTQTQSDADTQTGEDEDEGAAGGGADDSDSSGTDGEQDGTDGDDSDEDEDEGGEDPVAKAVEAARVAALEEGKTLGRQEAFGEKREQERKETLDEVKNLFPSAMRDSRAAAAKVTFEVNGEQVTLSKEQVDSILAPFEAHNLKSLQANEQLALRALGDAFYARLPEAEHDGFTAAVNGKQLPDWLDAYAERKALATDAFKSITTVDDLEKVASPKLKADIARRDAAKYEEGRKKGRKDPSGEPDIGASKAGASTKWDDLRAGYGAGTLTDAQESEYLRQRAEREKAS